MVEQGGEPQLLIPTCCLSYAKQSHASAFSRHCVRSESSPLDVPLGWRPFLHGLRRVGHVVQRFVRPLRRYYDAIRLPRGVPVGLRLSLPRPSPATVRQGSLVGLPVLAHRVSTHARVLRLRGVKGQLALNATLHVVFPNWLQGRHADKGDFGANIPQPMCTPVNASPRASPLPAHDSGPERVATPSQYGSLIRNSMPVYPGAFSQSPFSTTRLQFELSIGLR